MMCIYVLKNKLLYIYMLFPLLKMYASIPGSVYIYIKVGHPITYILTCSGP
jgi:hypothetical protein